MWQPLIASALKYWGRIASNLIEGAVLAMGFACGSRLNQAMEVGIDWTY